MVEKIERAIENNKPYSSIKQLNHRFNKLMEAKVVEHLSPEEELAFRKCMKEELQKHSYLTASKNVRTAE
jgi:hypothetical protein